MSTHPPGTPASGMPDPSGPRGDHAGGRAQDETDAGRLGRLEDVVATLHGMVGDLIDGPNHPDPGDPGQEWETYYADVADWVADRFAPGYTRSVGGQARWCAQWWDHAEAISRLECLWRTWEAARLEPVAGMATWYTTQLDHHLPILLSPDGPFQQCTPDRHTPLRPLPLAPPPPDWWPSDDPHDPYDPSDHGPMA